jgi:hypothetical protein
MAEQSSEAVNKLAGGFLPMQAGDSSGAKWLISAVLAAGQGGCVCTACQLLKKFGGELSAAMLKESSGG